MKPARVLSLIILTSGFLLSSCKKEPVIVHEGTVRLIINVNHHGYPTANAVIFRKNGTVDYPGTDTSLYDTRYVADVNGNLTLTDIGNGDKALVLYTKGFDPTWDTLIVTPVSGYQFVITSSAIGESKDYSVVIPVSE